MTLLDLEFFNGDYKAFYRDIVNHFGGYEKLKSFIPCNIEDIATSMQSGDTELNNLMCGGKKICKMAWNVCAGFCNSGTNCRYSGYGVAGFIKKKYPDISLQEKECIGVLKEAAKIWYESVI